MHGKEFGHKNHGTTGDAKSSPTLSFVEAKFTANSWQEGRHTAELAPLK